MAGSTFGTIFRITTWGESHGPAIGAVIDGCPAGISLTEDDFPRLMDRRRPNGGSLSTKRVEADRVEILSGTFEGKTTGTPISLFIRNTDQRSKDYGNIAALWRPGHADYGFDVKYGFRDYRGGGRSSGRETAARVAAGVIAEKMLFELGISFETAVTAIGGVPFSSSKEIIDTCRAEGDSLGSEVKCIIHGVPAGIGDPVFNKLDALLAQAIFSIGAVKAMDIGDGRSASLSSGSENNDPFRIDKNGKVITSSNHAGGILGGISDGSDIILRVYFKPTPSIAKEQLTVNRLHEETSLSISGRHDPVIGPRAAVVVEAMAALTLADSLLINMTAKMDSVSLFYKNTSGE